MSRFLHAGGSVFCLLLFFNRGDAQERLSFQQAIELAHKQNPQLVIAEQQIAAAAGRVTQAGAFSPVEIFSRFNEISFDFADYGEFEIGLSQSFEFPGKRGSRKAVATVERQITEWRLARLRALVAAEVKKSYFENLLVQENFASQQFIVQILEDLQRLLTQRYQTGAATYVDVIRARIELGRGRSELAAARQEHVVALAKLNLLLGQESDRPIEFSDSLAYAPLEMPHDSLLAQVMRQSNLRKILEMTVERQRRALQLARLSGRPDFSLGAAFQRVAENPPFTTSQPQGQIVNAFGVEASISLPIFNRAAPSGEKQSAQTELVTAETQLTYFEQHLRGQFEIAFAGVAAAEQQVIEFRDVVLPESESAVNAAAAVFQSGQLSLTDVLDIYRTARQARLEHNRALLNYVAARADLEAVGETVRFNLLQE
jgi:outer membrane protein TolC